MAQGGHCVFAEACNHNEIRNRFEEIEIRGKGPMKKLAISVRMITLRWGLWVPIEVQNQDSGKVTFGICHGRFPL